jgi:hypothetical protein
MVPVLGYAHFYYIFSVMYKLPPWLYRYALDLLQQTRSNVQGYWYNEYYLYDIHTGKYTRVRQPGLGNEAITHLSTTNGRMSGEGAKPFQITPDGTCIRLEALRIRNSLTATPVLFSSLYSKPLTTHHISSNGCITLSTYDQQYKTVILQISPNNDADGDGLSDDWETSEIQYLIAGDPTQWGYLAAEGSLDATTTYWQDGYTALQSFVLGLSADSRELSKTTDLDLDGVDNSDDAAPDDSTINWKRTAEPKFAVIELPVTDVESLRLDDFSENGTVLFTRIDATINGYVHRVLVDRRIAAHVVPIAAQHGGFGGIGPTLIGDRMLGFRKQTPVECTWNPLDDSYVAFPLLMYHDDICDVRGNFRVDRTFPGLKTPQGLLTGSTWCKARIEQNGNIVSSDGGYWRFNHNTSTYGPINTLAEHTIARSATLTQTEPAPQGSGQVTRTWNLVPGLTGLHISDEAAPFVKSQLAFNSSRTPLGVTQQGWVATASEIWSNGTWQPLKNLLGGTTPQQATLLGILDTGLGVAIIQHQTGAAKMVLLVPVELISDLNNDGQINAADNQARDASYGPLPPLTQEIVDRGTEFMFPNNQRSNGMWDVEDSDPDKPAEADDDDAQPIVVDIGSLPKLTKVWLEHPASTGLKYYRDRKCTQEIPLSSSQPHVVGGSVAWPNDNKLFLRVEDTLDFPDAANPQLNGDLVLKIKVGTNGREIEAQKMRLLIVKTLGAQKYFHAARDYILENNTKYFRDRKEYIATAYTIVAMREESTMMFGLDTYHHTAYKPRLKGIDAVKANYDADVIINGNQCFKNDGLAMSSLPYPGGMTDRCDGRLCIGGLILRPPSDDTHSPDLGGADARYVGVTEGEPSIINGQIIQPKVFTFSTGQVPEGAPTTPNQGMGGLTAKYDREELQVKENQLIARSRVTENGKGIIFTATNPAGVAGNPILLAADAHNSGVQPLAGGAPGAWELLFLDGSSSVGLVLANPDGVQKTLIKGDKHIGVHYYVNTYLLFECEKPR